MRRSFIVLNWLLFAALLPFCATAGTTHVIKFATLAPPGTTWMNILEEWGQEVKTRSKGRLVFKFYPGGVQGDEPDVLKKMRFNQLQGGAFTGYGIGRMYSPARVLELPFLFNDIDEVDLVRRHFTKTFQQGFHDNGYELLGWMEVGFIHMFSTEPIRSLEDMRSRRVWLWQGDPIGQAFFQASGISPVPLSIIDVYTSLSTGLIDTVYAPPLGAIALQWFTKTRYISSIPLTNGMGGLIVTRRFVDRLPKDLQALLRETGNSYGEKLVAATRVDNAKSIDELKKRGLEFIEPDEGMSDAELLALRNRAADALIKSNYIPASVFEQTRKLLDQHRHARATAGTPAP
ncbi:TRAP-type C4-dicarboxylate transport system substrate-binding protein [Thiogranum longum]|uniref:TRAP-type C4-dicarboxylate transport system substrate-binding protein n=1 Tax=Thiogranum longum TaxID=1537524 RepID=A0A4R1H9B4_9GAMM|nr:TRAP transporter substrate-binding protein DctP [Thiogranum longum]TCK18467.1 TRAP-type C4-dicarboxylate transport system substrate-binding protein [Thiogranum longum]